MVRKVKNYKTSQKYASKLSLSVLVHRMFVFVCLFAGLFNSALCTVDCVEQGMVMKFCEDSNTLYRFTIKMWFDLIQLSTSFIIDIADLKINIW